MNKIIQELQKHWKKSKEFNHPTYEGYKIERRKKLAEMIVAKKPKSVLEIGCFGGYNLRLINQMDDSIELTGLDINLEALNYAKSKLPSLKTIHGSIYDLENLLGNQKFDVIFTSGVLIHIPCSTQSHTHIQSICSAISNHSLTSIFHAEHHGEHFHKMPSKGMRYIHNFNTLYKDSSSISINRAFMAGDGFEHFITVDL